VEFGGEFGKLNKAKGGKEGLPLKSNFIMGQIDS
jgi:hypothetical protein